MLVARDTMCDLKALKDWSFMVFPRASDCVGGFGYREQELGKTSSCELEASKDKARGAYSPHLRHST